MADHARRPGDARTGDARPHPTRVGARQARRAALEAKRRGRRRLLVAVLGAIVLVVGVGFGATRLFGGSDPGDYAASDAGAKRVIEVQPGDGTAQVAQTLLDAEIVKTTGAFTAAAAQRSEMTALQPGYYQLAEHQPAADAVDQLLQADSRVGHLTVAEGRQLIDSHDVQTGATKKGIFTLIAEASCWGETPTCLAADDIRAAASADPAELGVPAWALDRVRALPDRSRQLEGLIAAGTWEFDPRQDATSVVRSLLADSTAAYAAAGLTDGTTVAGLDPYRALTVASLIEREAKPEDFAKVARVIVNRLAINQPLQLDSTVNYSLDGTELATTGADRARVTAWNTYAMTGLPASPIASPSIDAVRAAENPEPGDWLYFVTVDASGTTVFSHDFDEHLGNADRAQASGILDSGR